MAVPREPLVPVPALVPVVPQEPADPVRARVALALVVLAQVFPAHSAVLAQRPAPADLHPPRQPAAPVRVQLPVLAHQVLEPVVPVEPLRSRQSSSAAMARSTT